jgi:hypothetical protein
MRRGKDWIVPKPSTTKWRKPRQKTELPLQLNLFKGTPMTNFASILDMPAEDVKPPALLPVGTYHTVIAGLPETGKSSQKQTDFFKFKHRIVAALDDVDADALNEAYPEGIQGKEIDNTLYLTEKSLFMLTDMLKNCGIDFGGGKSVGAAVDESPNCEVGIVIKHEPSQDGQRIFARVARTVALS